MGEQLQGSLLGSTMKGGSQGRASREQHRGGLLNSIMKEKGLGSIIHGRLPGTPWWGGSFRQRESEMRTSDLLGQERAKAGGE